MTFGFLAACSSEETLAQIDLEEAPSSIDEQRTGSLLAEFHHPRQDREGGMSVHAQFLDVRGMPVEMAMEALEVWTPDRSLSAGSCRLRTPDWTKSPSHQGQVELHLLDVGLITIDSPTHRLRLEGRRLPDLLSAFSGVLYDMDQGIDAQGDPLDYHPFSLYHFHAPGVRDTGIQDTVLRGTGGFSVELIAPEPIQIVGVSHHDMSFASTLRLASGTDLILEWSADHHSTADVYIDVATGVGPDHPHLKCRADDEGTFTIPAPILEQLLDEVASVDITIRRVATMEVLVDGLDEAMFIMAASDEVTVIFD
ncbi:MAG: hypothetical protein ACNA8W_00315 [Bradymonadaceae bacterium]